jgi:membrane-associated HD superfamily phosphohydrolase
MLSCDERKGFPLDRVRYPSVVAPSQQNSNKSSSYFNKILILTFILLSINLAFARQQGSSLQVKWGDILKNDLKDLVEDIERKIRDQEIPKEDNKDLCSLFYEGETLSGVKSSIDKYIKKFYNIKFLPLHYSRTLEADQIAVRVVRELKILVEKELKKSRIDFFNREAFYQKIRDELEAYISVSYADCIK